MTEHVELKQRTCYMYHDMDGKPVVCGHRLINEGDLVFQYEYTKYEKVEVG